eukprot:2860690-Pleurochrysis_carterae.AAC.1
MQAYALYVHTHPHIYTQSRVNLLCAAARLPCFRWRHLLKTSYALHCFPPNSDPPANERMIHMGETRASLAPRAASMQLVCEHAICVRACDLRARSIAHAEGGGDNDSW